MVGPSTASIDMPYLRDYAPAEPSRDAIDALGGTTVLEFGAPWCGHCIAAQPGIEAAFGDQPDLRHIKIEDGRGRPLGRSFKVKLWPTLVVLRDGVERARLVRPTDADALRRALANVGDVTDTQPPA